MITQGWDELRKNKAEVTKVLKEAGLSPALAQLRWAALTKSDRLKIGRVSTKAGVGKVKVPDGKGWHEEKESTITKKGVEKKAPVHRKVANKKAMESTLRKPMVKKKPELISEPEPTEVAREDKPVEVVVKEPEVIQEPVVEPKPEQNEIKYEIWDKYEEDGKIKSGVVGYKYYKIVPKDQIPYDISYSGVKAFHGESAGVYYSKLTGETYFYPPLDKENYLIYLRTEEIHQPPKNAVTDIYETHDIYTVYQDNPLMKGTDTAKIRPVYGDKSVYIQGVNTDKPPGQVVSGNHPAIRPVEQVKHGKWRFAPNDSIEIILTSLKIRGFEVIDTENIKTVLGEPATRYIIAKKRQKREKKAVKEPEYITQEGLVSLLDLDAVDIAEKKAEELKQTDKKSPLLIYLESELKKQEETLEAVPIPVKVITNKDIIQSGIFAIDNPVTIDLIFDKGTIRIHYYKIEGQARKRLEVTAINKAGDIKHHDRDYEAVPFTDEILKLKEVLEDKKEYYVRLHDGTKEKAEYDVQPFEYNGIQLFAHSIRDKDNVTTEWHVSEETTGVQIGVGSSTEKAIDAAKNIIDTKGVGTIKAILAKVK